MNNNVDTNEMNNFLKDLYSSLRYYKTRDKNFILTSAATYEYLIKRNVPDESRNFIVGKRRYNYLNESCKSDDIFQKWIDGFSDVDNIDVYCRDNWARFCQFKNNPHNVPVYCVKMYIPLDFPYIEEGVKRIFTFLAENNISHDSKVSNKIRFDDVVVRLSKMEDAIKLQKFLDNDLYIREALGNIKPSVFAFCNNGINYSLDGYLSYNFCFAELVSSYLNTIASSKFFIKNFRVNVDSFYNYIDDISKDFEKIKSVMLSSKKKITEDSVVDAFFIVNLIKKRLKTNNMNEYINYLNYVNNPKVEQSVRQAYIDNDMTLIIGEEELKYMFDKEELLKEVILTAMKKYPLSEKGIKRDGYGMDLIESFIYNNNIKAVSRDNNLRERVRIGLNKDDVYQIIMNSNVMGNDFNSKLNDYVKKVMLEDIVRNMRLFAKDQLKKRGKNSDNEYLIDEVVSTQFAGFFNENDIYYISYRYGAARRLVETFSPEMIKKFLQRYDATDILDYMKKNVDVTRNFLNK